MHVLVSGFEPFAGEQLNPSQECVNSLARNGVDGLRVSTLVLPVARGRAPEALLASINALEPDAILMLGEAGGRCALTPERIAINVDDFAIPDNDGAQPNDCAIVATGPAAYLSTLPLRAMERALHERNVPVEISNSAGTYVCNHVFYRVLHALSERRAAVAAGFMHLPYSAEQGRADDPSLPQATLDRAVRVCLSAIAQAGSQAGSRRGSAPP